MIINFGGYRVTFSAGEQPVYLQLAWPVGTNPHFIKVTQDQAAWEHRDRLRGLDLIAIEQKEHAGIAYELALYGKSGLYTAISEAI